MALAAIGLWGASVADAESPLAESDRIPAPTARPAAHDWPLHGRDASEQRFSPLDAINRETVERLGLAWTFELGSKRGIEATPIMVDGVLYVTSTWSVVFALDARDGSLLWRFDPAVDRAKGRDACCDVVNRGVAVSQGRVFVGALDGRLIALDAKSGEKVWETWTVDRTLPYTITGAPRVVKGKVVIGNGGAEFGVRGYVSAYDAETGKRVWRFYTVPASHAGPHEHPELADAAKTWSPDSLWETGLGGTAWDSMAYDRALDLLYVGVGNASVYERERRSPGGGDNLFVASILALRPDTGELVWHYQTTPGDSWDYTATQHMILADLELGGRTRQVLLQAPKNGFFYVLDRATGELLSAENYVPVSWATHVDLETGRPKERAAALWSEGRAVVTPAVQGGHSWHPMSFHPETGLVYLPVQNLAYIFEPDPAFEFQTGSGSFNTAEDLATIMAEVEGHEHMNLAFCEPTELVAWDPRRQRAAWRLPSQAGVPGGTLATGGGLVFQGDGGGFFRAFDAVTGEKRFEADVGTGIMAPPVTYALDGTQYIAVLSGLGGSQGGHNTTLRNQNRGRVLVWALGGKAPVPRALPRPTPTIEAPKLEVSSKQLDRGRARYAKHCLRCHGVGARSSGLYPDLRHASGAVWESWDDIVLQGTRTGGGMASFSDVLDTAASHDIRAYVASRAHASPSLAQQATRWFAENGCVPASWIVD
ncbi:MAG: PQQ-dependent dehydrogenase, methanol/ethanol family [Myxococcota bacterium]